MNPILDDLLTDAFLNEVYGQFGKYAEALDEDELLDAYADFAEMKTAEMVENYLAGLEDYDYDYYDDYRY